VHDQFALGRRLRILNIVDDVTRECLAAIPDTSISGKRVARELAALIDVRGKPQMIVSDNVLCQEAAGGFGQQVSAHRHRPVSLN
jgi:putative transposase